MLVEQMNDKEKIMSKVTAKYPEIENIKGDIDSLKENTIELGKHIKKDGSFKTSQLKGVVSDKVQQLSDKGQEQLKNVEGRVKDKPLQSVAIAFAAGLFISALLGRR